MKQPFYITTSIAYTNGRFHIGHCYEATLADAVARFKRLQGNDVFFLTGSDEHGLKIARAAEKSGKSPQEFVDNIVDMFKDAYQKIGISYNKFIRTTDQQHKEVVSNIFTKLYESGDIYKSFYEGPYCVPCEAQYTNSELVDGKCPSCGREVETIKEDSYFLRLSKYQSFIENLFEENPNFLQPIERRNEIINNFIKPGLQDISVSRNTFDWGIKVPFDTSQVIYVWIDALSNYISALGYSLTDDSNFKKYWPANYHLVGKDITRFHVIIWPILLHILGLPLPKQVHSHGFFTTGGEKLSKSKNNSSDPLILVEKYGVDAFRYFMLKEGPLMFDSNFDDLTFLNTSNTDLSNDLGNLLSRTTAMTEQYFNGIVPNPTDLKSSTNESDLLVFEKVNNALANITLLMDKFLVNDSLFKVFDLVRTANRYIEQNEPWKLKKENTETSLNRLAQVIYTLNELIRVIAVLLQPFLVEIPQHMFDQLGVSDESLKSFDSVKEFCFSNFGQKTTKGQPLFKRLDIEKEISELTELLKASQPTQEGNNMEKINENTASSETNIEEAKTENLVITKPLIKYDDFAKIELKVGTIIASEKIEKSDKLLKNTIDINGQQVVIVSGIALHYKPEDIIGKQVVVVVNLAPIKLRGVESNGMILCAVDETTNKLTLISPSDIMPTGSQVS